MRLILDTHCFLWMQVEPERLGKKSRELLEAASTELLLSAASGWEIAIKAGLGKLPLSIDAAQYVTTRMQHARISPMSVTMTHALAVEHLALNHRDPFDRILIAQALVEQLPIMTADRLLEAYDAELLDATS